MSKITDIADAVVTALNSGTFSQTFTAQRLYLPVYDLPDMETLRVAVVPRGLTREIFGRDSTKVDYIIDVAIQQKPASLDNATLDALTGFVQEVADSFDRATVNFEGGRATCIQIDNQPIYAPDHLETFHQFTSVLSLTFRRLQ